MEIQPRIHADAMIRWLFWLWLLLLIALNIIPLGNNVNRSLSGNKLWEFRLDYLTHLAMILVFAWIWIWGRIRNVRWFSSGEVIKYSLITVLASIGLELIQIFVPWRTFNPIDLAYNLVGSLLGIVFVCISRRLAQKKARIDAG